MPVHAVLPGRRRRRYTRRGPWPPEAARRVAGGASGASDHRSTVQSEVDPSRGRGGIYQRQRSSYSTPCLASRVLRDPCRGRWPCLPHTPVVARWRSHHRLPSAPPPADRYAGRVLLLTRYLPSILGLRALLGSRARATRLMRCRGREGGCRRAGRGLPPRSEVRRRGRGWPVAECRTACGPRRSRRCRRVAGDRCPRPRS